MKVVSVAYIRMFRRLFVELNDRAKVSTESRELRSVSMTWSFALGFCSRRLAFTLMPLSIVLDGSMTSAPLSARTLAVSFPMPFVAPGLRDIACGSHPYINQKARLCRFNMEYS